MRGEIREVWFFLNCKLTAVFHGVVASNSMKKRFKIYGPDVVVFRCDELRSVGIHAVPLASRAFVISLVSIRFQLIPLMSNDLLLCRVEEEKICNKEIG